MTTASDPTNPGVGYRLVLGIFRLLARAFFQSIEVSGREHVPRSGGGIVVAWHPNGLVDALLILSSCPRPVVFGARHGLFEIPILGRALRILGTVPLHRPQDKGVHASPEARRAANTASLESMAEAATSALVAIFPEGVTHDGSQLLELRTGAARLFFMATDLTLEGAPPPVLLPVGLHYDKKDAFRSRALVSFHPPMTIPQQCDEPPKDERQRARALTGEIEKTLRDVVHATDSWELNQTMQRGRKLLRAERAARAGVTLGPVGMAERELGFSRMWVGYYARMKTHPVETERVMTRIRRYDEVMRMLRLEDRDLDRSARRPMQRRLLLLGAKAVLVYLLLPPLVVFGYIVNLPTALALKIASLRMSESRKERAGIKVMLGALAFPLTWLIVSIIIGWARPSFWTTYSWTPQTPALAAISAFFLCAASGVLALRYHRLAVELGRTVRSLATRRRRIDAVRRMRKHRSKIHDSLMELAAGLDLPGELAPDGSLAAHRETGSRTSTV